MSLRGEKEERRVRGVKEGRYSAIPSHADCIIHAGHAGLCCVAMRCVVLRCVALRCVVLYDKAPINTMERMRSGIL